jgi:hypothetical protein
MLWGSPTSGNGCKPNFKETEGMKRTAWAVLIALLGFTSSANAQMGMDLFRKPSISKVFHPVVGKGAEYQTTSTRSGGTTTQTLEMGVVGKDTVDGKDGYWMQFTSFEDKDKPRAGKALITVDDFQFHRMIIEVPGQGAMEMPVNMNAKDRNTARDEMSDLHSVGSETITVPGGTFVCEHWKNDKDGSEVWTSDKVTPFGLVKEVRKDHTMVLVKLLDNVPDRITGPVKKFDLQQMMQQRQQQKPQ